MDKTTRKKKIKQQHVIAQTAMAMFELFLGYCVVSTYAIGDKMTYDCTSFELLKAMFGFIGIFYLLSIIFPVVVHGEIHDYYFKKRMRVDDPYWKFNGEI